MDTDVASQTVDELVDKFRRAQAGGEEGVVVVEEEEDDSAVVDDNDDEDVDDDVVNDDAVVVDINANTTSSTYTYVSELSPDEEWETVVTQLQLLVLVVAVPLAGKFLGRRFAHSLWSFFGSWYYNK